MVSRQGSSGDRTAQRSDDQLGRMARTILANRRLRSTLLPAEIFGEWAWDALLTLFVADAEGRRLTGRMLAEELDCRPQTMARWMQHLLANDLIVSRAAPDPDRPLTLSARSISALEVYLAKVAETTGMLPEA